MRISDWSSDVCSSDLFPCTRMKSSSNSFRSRRTLSRKSRNGSTIRTHNAFSEDANGSAVSRRSFKTRQECSFEAAECWPVTHGLFMRQEAPSGLWLSSDMTMEQMGKSTSLHSGHTSEHRL